MPRITRMPSQAQINAQARAMQREIERKVKCATNNGRRALTKSEIERIGREAARKLRF